MRVLVLALVLTFAASPLFPGQPASVSASGAADLLPKESDLKGALAPLTVTNFMQGPGVDGWDVGQVFQVNGTPDGPVLASVDASELPTSEGAAGFLQTKLQQLRDSAAKQGAVGDVKPADANLTQDADEAYFAVFLTPDGAPNRFLTAFLISRYDDQVTSVQTLMNWEGPGTIPESAKTSVGTVLGMVAKQVNDLATED